MKVDVFRDAEAIPLTRQAWNALCTANDVNTVFQTHEWFHSWWRALGRDNELHFLLASDGIRICGFAPFMITSAGGQRRLQFVGGMQADYSDIVAAQDCKAEVISAIVSRLAESRREWDELYLRNLVAHAVTARTIGGVLQASRISWIRAGVVMCPALRLAGEPAKADALLGKYSLRRPHNWFASRGSLNCRMLANEAELLAYLPRFFEQHVARWSGTASPSRFTEVDQQGFFEQLGRDMLRSGWLSFAVAEYNGQLLAAHFGFNYAGTLTWYKPSYNPTFSSRSPGLVLLRFLIEHAKNNGIAEIDFTIGEEPFKKRFMSRAGVNIDIRAFSKRVPYARALLVTALLRLGGMLKAAVRGRSRLPQSTAADGM